MKQGRRIDQALLQAKVNKNLQTMSYRRLVKDLAQIDNETVETVLVTARSLETSLYVWHANIRGAIGTCYEGGIFHIEMQFPKDYPFSPPKINLLTNIAHHPNVFGNTICLDLLSGDRSNYGCGWSSGYTVQSILMQLQSFLLLNEADEKNNVDKFASEVKACINNANSYECKKCGHGGKLSCWPPFKQALKDAGVVKPLGRTENDILRDQLVCYHSKTNYKEKQLGLGIKITKIPRTGQIREGEIYFDYLSVHSFISRNICWSATNETMTHWLPVYFGNGDNDERFLHLLKKSLSMIMTNSTKSFVPEQAVEVFTKLIVSLSYSIMDLKKHPSIRMVRILTHLHSMFLFILRKHPELRQTIDEKIKNFIESEACRHKDVTSNLGVILAYMTVTDKFKFKDVVEAYFQEMLDRQVLWIIKDIPDFLKAHEKGQLNDVRSELVFKSRMSSFQLLTFFKLFVVDLCEARPSREVLLDSYLDNLCKLNNNQQVAFQAKIKYLIKEVNSFEKFFELSGMKQRTPEELTKVLSDAVNNSSKKKYHGSFEVLHQLPDKSEQYKELMKLQPQYEIIAPAAETQAPPTEGDVEKVVKIKDHPEQEWKAMCIKRWTWIDEAIQIDATLSASELSKRRMEDLRRSGKPVVGEVVSSRKDKLLLLRDSYKESEIKLAPPKVVLPALSWKDLFVRLDLEEYLTIIDSSPDFKVFYQKLDVCAGINLSTLCIPLLNVTRLKSAYYYLTAILTRLTCLKYVEFSFVDNASERLSITEKMKKALMKGFHNFLEKGGRLEFMSFSGLIFYHPELFTFFEKTLSMISISFVNCQIPSNLVLQLTRYLSNMKDLQSLSFEYCTMPSHDLKSIADAVMRLKKLRIFTIRENGIAISDGLASIIYNLAFSSSLVMLTIDTLAGGSAINGCINSLEKLIEISGSIEILNLTDLANFSNSLSKNFWLAVAKSVSLRVLNLNGSGKIVNTVFPGFAVAYNAKKNGSLQYMNLSGVLCGNYHLESFVRSMMISEYDEEEMYGNTTKLATMVRGNYEKVFFNNLKAIQLDKCENMQPAFSLVSYNQLLKKEPNHYVNLLSRSPHLTSVSMENSILGKPWAENMTLVLDTTLETCLSRIKVLNLRNCSIGKQGMRALTQVLPNNNIIEVLDVSKNFLGVAGVQQLIEGIKNNTSLKFLSVFSNAIGFDGAKQLAEKVLAKHPRLEFLDIGLNRIRDRGFSLLVENVMKNPSSKLKYLATRFNFLNGKSILADYVKLTGAESPVEHLFLSNNQVDEYFISQLQSIYNSAARKIHIDLFHRTKVLENETLERTIWIAPCNKTAKQIKHFFEEIHNCGIVVNVRTRRGRDYPKKVPGANIFTFVEFANSNSVKRALHLASTRATVIQGTALRVFKAGSATFVFMKRKKSKKGVQKGGKRGARPGRGARPVRGGPRGAAARPPRQ